MSTLVPGFASPVHEAQQCFHTVLHAMSSPCTLHTLPVLPPQPVVGSAFSAGMAALALTLCDGETPLWLQPELNTEPLRRYLRFHCGAVFASVALMGQAFYTGWDFSGYLLICTLLLLPAIYLLHSLGHQHGIFWPLLSGPFSREL